MNDFSSFSRNERFQLSFKNLMLGVDVSEAEISYLLSCSIIFLSEYLIDRRKKGLFDIGYYIVLKYSTDSGDYEPLYDVSVNFGLFPIASYIDNHNLNDSPSSFSLDYKMRDFLKDEIIETLEQKESRDYLLSSKGIDSAFIAPTSYGKSSFIIDVVKKSIGQKIAVIVPTKSLLSQTYKLLADNVSDRKMIFHDEMYDGESEFVGILTQERALRLIGENDISFDTVIVDEAHNLFDKNFRSILLSRFLRKNRKRNSRSRNYYLSPLINDVSNLRFEETQNIDSYNIQRGIKEPKILEYRLDDEVYQYDRFCNEFYPLGRSDSYFSYIQDNLGSKNFFFHRTPRKIQEFSKELFDSLPVVNEEEELDLVSETISRNIHSDFYCVEYVKKGVVYLHGKLPDILKEYMEYKFKVVKSLKYIVANSVVLEGVNFPVDTLFILNTHSLDGKDLTNLIGRVNRLNMVFSGEGSSLSKLIPNVHFLNSLKYGGKKSKMENKIKELRSGVFKDKVRNPTLVSYDGGYSDSVGEVLDQQSKDKVSYDLYILDRENYLIDSDRVEEEKVRMALIECGLDEVYIKGSMSFDIVLDNVEKVKSSGDDVGEYDVVDLIYLVLINGLETLIQDRIFGRLSNSAARDFYKMFIAKNHRMSLKELVEDFVLYFYSIRSDVNKQLFYVGSSFGEVGKRKDDGSYTGPFYVNLRTMSQKEIVNIALVKIKMETDFVSYRLHSYAKFLYIAGVLSENAYEIFVYGSADRVGSKLGQLGISGALISKLDRDNMLAEISLNDWGRIEATNVFREYLAKQDDLFQFEFNKYF